MVDIEALVSIGVFARQVGLAPSALRFYDDCGVLQPAYVEETTGYRYYAPHQEARAVLIRRLREAEVPLTDASVVLDGSAEEAHALLEAHARRTRDKAAAAQVAIEEILRALAGGGGQAQALARVGGAELSSAIRQVTPAVASARAREEFPVLGCVLVELDGYEVRLAATDRYRLAVRTLRPSEIVGGRRHVVVDACVLSDIASWALRLPDLTIEIDDQAARLRGGRNTRTLPTMDGTFPDYRSILINRPAARTRVITDRSDLCRAIADSGPAQPVTLHTDTQHLVIARHDMPEIIQPAICTGPPLRIAFDPGVLGPALDASVGPDVLLEISSTTQPVVVRSADQGSFTTLVMPTRDTPAK